jgi:hypothetical protein
MPVLPGQSQSEQAKLSQIRESTINLERILSFEDTAEATAHVKFLQ